MVTMEERVEEFICANLDLIDNEEWENLLEKCISDLPNSFIQKFFEYLEAADIDIEELAFLRTNKIIENIEAVLKSLDPGSYRPSQFIHNIKNWVGYGGLDIFNLIYFNPHLWPDNIEIIDNGYRNGDSPYFIVEVT